MGYIGTPVQQALTKATSQYFNGTGSQTVFTLNRAVNVPEDLEVFVNNIQQEPGVGKSYTATGTTLTFDAAPSSGTGNIYVIYRGSAEVTRRLEHDPNAALAATTGTFSGDLTVDSSTLYVDSTNNLVGVGTSAPSGAKLDIFTGSTTADGLKINRFGSGVYYSTLRQDTHGLAVRVGDGSNIAERVAITPNGITFNGDTAAANALDDYEEGTWTPTLLGTSSNPTFSSINNTTGFYVKIGNMVHVTYYSDAIVFTGAGSGTSQIGNLPFTAANGTNEYWLFKYIHGTAMNGTTTGGYVNVNGNIMTFVEQNNTGSVAWHSSGSRYLMVSASYKAA